MRRGEKPLTKAGQLRALWPEIQIALDDGQSVRADQGVVLKINHLRTYISRIRRERRKKAAERLLEAAMPPSAPNPAATPQISSPGSADANITWSRADSGRSPVRSLGKTVAMHSGPTSLMRQEITAKQNRKNKAFKNGVRPAPQRARASERLQKSAEVLKGPTTRNRFVVRGVRCGRYYAP
jgi:hypothetical protein